MKRAPNTPLTPEITRKICQRADSKAWIGGSISTSAFGQTTVKLGFLSHDKQTQYCDFEQLTVEKGSVVTGVHLIAPGGF